jgi:hypothetical protein
MLAGSALALGSADKDEPAAVRARRERMQMLAAAVEGEDPLVRGRAMREIANHYCGEVDLRRKLFTELSSERFSQDEAVWPEFFMRLPDLGGDELKDFLSSYLAAAHPRGQRPAIFGEPIDRVLIVLGRMDDPWEQDGKSAVPFLLKQLSLTKDDEGLRTSIEIALLHVGHDTTEIRDDLRKSFLSRPNPPLRPLRMFGMSGVPKSLQEETLPRIKLWLHGQGDTPVFAALALRSCGPQARPFAPDLITLAQEERKHPSARAAVYECVLSMIDPQTWKESTKRAMKDVGRYPSNPVVLFWLVPCIGSYKAELMLDDPDTAVQAGALTFLMYAGLSGGSAHQVIKLLDKSKNQEIRLQAAQSLSIIADWSDLMAIKEILRDERDEDVREALQEAVRIMQLQPSTSTRTAPTREAESRPGR